MTEDIFTGILTAYRKEEISIQKAKRQIRLLLDGNETSDSKRPHSRTIREGVTHFCDLCGSTLSRRYLLVGKRYCDSSECPNSMNNQINI